MLVLAGWVNLQLGQHREQLGSGDSATFAGDRPHGYANASRQKPARFALTVFQPQVGGGPRA